MKAITCPQCGATLENVSERSTIIECEYCGARILLAELEDKTRSHQPIVPVEPPDFDVGTGANSSVNVGLAVGSALLVAMVIVTFAIIRKPAPKPVQAYSAPSSTPSPSGTPPTWNWSANDNTASKPLPNVNYQPRVSWDGPNDLEYFADPEVDVSSVSDLTSEEVKKTVFKDRVVKLRVVINTSGEIDEVETISGHPILVAAATESAKRSIFSSRSKPTTRVLTYTFRVLKD